MTLSDINVLLKKNIDKFNWKIYDIKNSKKKIIKFTDKIPVL